MSLSRESIEAMRISLLQTHGLSLTSTDIDDLCSVALSALSQEAPVQPVAQASDVLRLIQYNITVGHISVKEWPAHVTEALKEILE